MVDAVTSFALERIGDSLLQEVSFLLSVKEQVEEMKMELEWMQCFLEDADKNPISSRTFHHWVSQIKEANYEAEDTIDSFLAKAALRRKKRNVFNFIRRFIYFVSEGRDIHLVGRNIQAINAKLATLRSRLQTYGVLGLSVRENSSSYSTNNQMMMLPRTQNRAFSISTEHDIVGLDEMNERVVKQLLNNQEEPYRVVSIYGMGGLGKTTLAKKVYHDIRVRSHFTSFAWIYVPQQFRKRDLWAEILIQLTSSKKKEKKAIGQMRSDEVKSRLQQIYQDQQKRCLVVVDGIRSISQEWDNLSDGFPCSSDTNSNNKMLVLTRKKEVAMHAGFSSIEIPLLNKDTSWELLTRILEEDASIYPDEDRKIREDLGKKMLDHCMGLPLAIVLLGGILSTKSGLWEWAEVLDEIRSLLRRCGNKEEWFGVLVLSYHELPNWLKPCFLYLSQFPEDHEIQTKQLLRMWMAEGLIYTSNDEIEDEEVMEDVAERNLNELASRYMIQVKEEGSTGRIKTCGMHNIIRDMCLWKAKQEKFVHIVNLARKENVTMESLSSSVDDSLENSSSLASVSNITNIRRIAIFAGKVLDADSLSQNPHLRSFACFSYTEGLELVEWKQTRPLLKNLQFLRVLALEGIKIGNLGLPKEIGTLICLGYLSLRGSCVSSLASLPLQNLVCLETLDLRFCTGFDQNVPVNWKWKMDKLRHLYLPQEELQIKQLDNLPNLETLVNFHVKDLDGLKELMIRNLLKLKKLTLRTSIIGKVGEMFRSTSQKEKPVVFSHLQSLCLKSPFGSEESLDLEAVMSSCPNLCKLSVQCQIENFPQDPNKFPSNLTKLHLKYCELGDISSLGKLHNLRILFLEYDSFVGTEMRFQENDFPLLKHLELDNLGGLSDWKVETGAMPSLCRLEINWCENLRSVPDGLKYVSNLKEIEIRGMPLEFRKRLQEGGVDREKVKHVPHISFVDCDDEY